MGVLFLAMGPRVRMRVGCCGVGLLFEIWIVDASIFVVCCSSVPHMCCLECRAPCHPLKGVPGWGFPGRGSPLCGGGGVGCGWGCCVVLVVASCEGHMVDALASRADEGRRSLR